MKFVLKHPKELDQIASIGRNGVYILKENIIVEVQGQLEIDNPLKVSGNATFTGTDGSSLTFTEKGSFNCSTSARRLLLSDLVLRSETDKPLFNVAQNTARSLVMHNVQVDAKTLGSCHAQNITMSQCSFLNADMTSMILGHHVDSLILNGVRHDGDTCLFDGCQTTFQGVGLVADAYIKNPDSGLILLNDKTRQHMDKRYLVPHKTFILTNIQGLTKPLDIFRQKTEFKYLTSMGYNLTEQYVI